MGVELLHARLAAGEVVLMDGAMGTELGGKEVDLSSPVWSAKSLASELGRSAILEVHAEAIKAGAEIIITNTFRTDWLGESSKDATLVACDLAQQARDQSRSHEVYIFGSLGPVGDCYTPEDTPTDAVLYRRHTAQIRWLKQGGVDLILAETMPTSREAAIAAECAAAAGMPVGVNLYFEHNKGTRMPKAEPLDQAVGVITAAAGEWIEILGANCVSPRTATQAMEYLAELRERQYVPAISVYAQGPDDKNMYRDEGVTDAFDHYMEQVNRWVQAGAQVVGGCCGVPPDWIESIGYRLSLQEAGAQYQN